MTLHKHPTACSSAVCRRVARAGGSAVTPRPLELGAIALIAAPGLLAAPAPAHAQEGVLHHVKYVVSAQNSVSAHIYYRDSDPPNWADYSHNPYVFSPRVEAEVSPDKAWVLEVMLADPHQWAMVTATGGLSPTAPMLHCELAVDGVVVDSNDGPKGALCSLRHW
jgi:hypothetical protein